MNREYGRVLGWIETRQCCLQDIECNKHKQAEIKEWTAIFLVNSDHKKPGLALLISDKGGF